MSSPKRYSIINNLNEIIDIFEKNGKYLDAKQLNNNNKEYNQLKKKLITIRDQLMLGNTVITFDELFCTPQANIKTKNKIIETLFENNNYMNSTLISQLNNLFAEYVTKGYDDETKTKRISPSARDYNARDNDAFNYLVRLCNKNIVLNPLLSNNNNNNNSSSIKILDGILNTDLNKIVTKNGVLKGVEHNFKVASRSSRSPSLSSRSSRSSSTSSRSSRNSTNHSGGKRFRNTKKNKSKNIKSRKTKSRKYRL